MAVYSIRTQRYGVQTGLPNTTDVVILFPFLSRQLAQRFTGWIRATRSGDDFTFFDANSISLGTQTLTRVDISKTVTGVEVLFEATAGRWESGRVISDGDKIDAGGRVFTNATRAAKVHTTVTPQDVSKITGFLVESGTSEDGDVWFSQNGEAIVRCDAVSTVGALAAGDVALVETSENQWEILKL